MLSRTPNKKEENYWHRGGNGRKIELLFLNSFIFQRLQPEAKIHRSSGVQMHKGKLSIDPLKWTLHFDSFFTSLKCCCEPGDIECWLKKVFLLLQVAGPGVHGPLCRPVSSSTHSVCGAQSLPSLVHPQPHREPAVRAGLHHAHCC